MHSAFWPVGLAGSIPWFAALAGLLAAASPSMTQGVDIPVEPSTGRARRVLIVTGEDYAGHLWRETAPALAAALAEDPRLSVETLDDLTKLAGTPLGDYDAVVLHFKNYDRGVPGREAFDNLRGYVEGGGGLVLTHFACGAFREFRDEFVAVVGRVFQCVLGHDARVYANPGAAALLRRGVAWVAGL